MISRKTARLIADSYIATFSNENFRLNLQELSDFIYDERYESWFWNVFQTSHSQDLVRQRIMNLHTGDTFQWFNQIFAEPQKVGQEFLFRLAESLLKYYEENSGRLKHAESHVQDLTAHLELDGYIYVRHKLYPTERSVIDEQAEQSYLELLINESNLLDKNLIKHHLNLSEQAYSESRWSDTISNARNFLESILSQVANGLSAQVGVPLPATLAIHPFQVRDYLENHGLIDSVEKTAIGKVYGLISNTGSHPNMAHRDQARLMRNLSLTFSQYVLLQWKGYVTGNP